MAAKPKPGKRTASAAASVQQQQYYLIQFSYTSAAWDTLLKAGTNERNRVAAVKSLVYKLGGCIATITFECDVDPTPKEKFGAFGDYDVVLLVAFPDDQARPLSPSRSARAAPSRPSRPPASFPGRR